MEYDPEQVEILMKKVASILGIRLPGFSKQQDNILENQLNSILIRHQGQAESITPEEIEGAYEIATVYAVFQRQFFLGVRLNHNEDFNPI